MKVIFAAFLKIIKERCLAKRESFMASELGSSYLIEAREGLLCSDNLPKKTGSEIANTATGGICLNILLCKLAS